MTVQLIFRFSLNTKNALRDFYVFLPSFSGIVAVDNESCALEKKTKTKSRYTDNIDDHFSSFGDSVS